MSRFRKWWLTRLVAHYFRTWQEAEAIARNAEIQYYHYRKQLDWQAKVEKSTKDFIDKFA